LIRPGTARALLFTDLDGTLLDFQTYRPSDEAVNVLRALSGLEVLVVPVSSKTSAEVRPLMADLELGGCAVTEGGAVLETPSKSRIVGLERNRLQSRLGRLRDEGWPVRGMGEMTVDEVVDLTGLSPGGAEGAMTRMASEPFVTTRELTREEAQRLARSAAALGAALTRGGRFWHLMGAGVDKAAGVQQLREELEIGSEIVSAAVGDAWNDLPMLEAVDHGFLLGDAVPMELVPEGVTRLDDLGPTGFVRAVEQVLERWRAAGRI
jgi:mannosyl-3-phosphoglycerate phosphatase